MHLSLIFVNWVSPSTVSAPIMEGQTQTVANILAQCERNVGILLTPLVSYRKNTVWQLEHQVLKALHTPRPQLLAGLAWRLSGSGVWHCRHRPVRDTPAVSLRVRGVALQASPSERQDK